MTAMSSPSKASSSSSNTGRGSESAPKHWAIVRHYSVLLSADKDKGETNRIWHDGRLTQHTYNGKLVLFDEAGIELASTFATSSVQLLFPDDHQVDVEGYLVQVQGFQRVTRTDIGALSKAREENKDSLQAQDGL